MRSSCSTNDPDRPAERGRIDKTHIDSALSVTMTPHDRQPSARPLTPPSRPAGQAGRDRPDHMHPRQADQEVATVAVAATNTAAQRRLGHRRGP